MTNEDAGTADMERPVKLMWRSSDSSRSLFVMEPTGQRPKGRSRRLITLIFEDRAKPAFMKVIRRELPLTSVAGPGCEALSHSGLEDPPPWASRPLAARLNSLSLHFFFQLFYAAARRPGVLA